MKFYEKVYDMGPYMVKFCCGFAFRNFNGMLVLGSESLRKPARRQFSWRPDPGPEVEAQKQRPSICSQRCATNRSGDRSRVANKRSCADANAWKRVEICEGQHGADVGVQVRYRVAKKSQFW